MRSRCLWLSTALAIGLLVALSFRNAGADQVPASSVAAPVTVSALDASVPVPPIELRLIEADRRLPIDLATITKLVVADNIDILEAKARYAEAEGVWDEALGELMPSLVASFRASRIDGAIQASFGELERHAFSTIVPAGRVEIGFNPGQVIFDALAAHRIREATDTDLDRVVQDTLARGASQYYSLLESQARVRIAEQAVASSTELARLAADRESQGVGLKVDVLRGEARVAEGEIWLAQARKEFRKQSVALALTLRLDPTTTLFPMDAHVKQRTLIDARRSVDALIEQALVNRPDMGAEELRVAAAESRHGARWAHAVGPTVYGSYEKSAIGRSIGNLDDRDIYGGFVGFRFSPASVGGVRAAGARLDRARLNAERLKQRVQAEVIIAREEALTAAEQVEASLRGVRAADVSLELSQVRFDRGVGIVLEVLEAQAAVIQARTNLVASIVAYNRAQVALLRALGGVSMEVLLGEGRAPTEPSGATESSS